MKKNIYSKVVARVISFLLPLSSFLAITSCDSDSIEGLSGTFSDVNFCDFTTATVQPTDKLGKGVKALNTTYTDAAGNTLTLRFGSKEWILPEGTYTPVPSILKSGSTAA